ncbi:hypothetical protein RND71_043461 [Anisodus tanguticus]|uniref:Tyrosine-protein phosphatase domain-containing protein n=1 Tax=Anisodus tanguticus TaxID=243964 RepID=A0AAE1UR54_9SOLA|nr:hypothetical protein RND71_043461 [Anisodus tanguticus]
MSLFILPKEYVEMCDKKPENIRIMLELCRQRMKNDFNNEIKKQEKEPKLGSNLSPKLKNQQTSNQPIENQIIQPSLVKEKDPLVSVAMNMNISTGHLILEYMENYLKQNGNKINRDWNALNKTNIEDYLESSQNAAKLCSSRNKNRYPDDLKTLPFDNSRVLLNDLESKDQTDYINASLILDADPQKPIYIATQGPLEQTICDFWQMIWEQGSSVIVMLTRLSENGIEQSARYWPEKATALISSSVATEGTTKIAGLISQLDLVIILQQNHLDLTHLFINNTIHQ